MFAIYGESNLPTIKSNAGPSEISNWKKSPEVKNCYKNLFEKVDNGDENSPFVITRIIEKVFRSRKGSNPEMAYVVAICTTMLNPKHDVLILSKSVMKRKVKSYLVGFVFLLFKKYILFLLANLLFL